MPSTTTGHVLGLGLHRSLGIGRIMDYLRSFYLNVVGRSTRFEPYGPVFLECWRTLPLELHFMVLSYLVPIGTRHPIPSSFSGQHTTGSKDIFKWPSYTSALMPLASVPEVQSLVYELFYSKNIMHVKDSWNLLPKYPPVLQRHFVRRLLIDMKLDMAMLDGLRGLKSARSFVDLLKITLRIDGNANVHSRTAGAYSNQRRLCIPLPGENDFGTARELKEVRDALENKPTIYVQSQELEVVYVHADIKIDEGRGDGYCGRMADVWEMPLLDKLTVESQTGEVNVAYERTYARWDVGEWIVEGWPERQSAEDAHPNLNTSVDPEGIRGTRTTRMLMWV
jgi:hypothetical protein